MSIDISMLCEYAAIDSLTHEEAIQLCDHINSQAVEIERLRGLVSEMADNDTYETEYDGRIYTICHGCGAQDGENHRNASCVYLRARAALSGEAT